MTVVPRRPISPTVARLERAVTEARELLSECLWDDEPWEPDALVDCMERVFLILGGDFTPPESGEENER